MSRFGPCMCGATDCPSCGPAQGYYPCFCGKWPDDDRCGHVDPETGELTEEGRLAQARYEDAEEIRAERRYEEEREIDQRAEEFWAGEDANREMGLPLDEDWGAK